MRKTPLLRRTSLLLVGVSLMSMIGCGAKSDAPKRDYADVSGKVTYKGEALKTGQVMFQPGVGALVTGDLKPDGTYSLKGVIGPNTVMIVSTEGMTAKPDANDPKTRQPPKSNIPETYGTPGSGLTYTVKKGDNKDANFDLK